MDSSQHVSEYLCSKAGGLKAYTVALRTKLAKLMVEFREIEAFGYESPSSSDEEGGGATGIEPLPLDAYVDNSVVQAGKALLLAAQLHVRETGGPAPAITLRLSRITREQAYADPRLTFTLSKLQELGVDAELGLRSLPLNPSPPPFPSPNSTSSLSIPANINLDLSILIALVSDITHIPLPADPDEADARFQPQTDRAWKRQLEKVEKDLVSLSLESSAGERADQDDAGAYEHCRALAEQTKKEMRHALLDEVSSRITSSGVATGDVQFWTTDDAKQRFLSITEKIGGDNERRRARALFGEDQGEASKFWTGSRYGPVFGGLPIRVFSSTALEKNGTAQTDLSFNSWLASTCRSILSQPGRQHVKGSDSAHEQRTIAAPLRFPGRLSEHTIVSLLRGAEHDMVTLTSNKTSIKAVIREMRGFALPRVAEENIRSSSACSIWITDPRSLAEGLRADAGIGAVDLEMGE